MIRRLLVANRGEIARRLIRGAHDAGCEAVAVFAADDAASPHVGEADVACCCPGVAGRDLSLPAAALVGCGRGAGADALHPGYGFLSENPVLPEACAAAGHRLGRAVARAMRVMGHKARAKELVAQAGVPMLPSAVVAPGSDDAVHSRPPRRVSGTPFWSRRQPAVAAAACASCEQPGELADAVARPSARRQPPSAPTRCSWSGT
jgi:acetyl/propionyl-CoA carboxylase alpha subunit